MNRDERHDRAGELAPQIMDEQYGIHAPLDPVGGGTWIAYNNAGYWACIVNGYSENVITPDTDYKSRGHIIPEILANQDPLSYAENFQPKNYLSFRLIVGSQDDVNVYSWNGQDYCSTGFDGTHNTDEAFFISSSSWEQAKVIGIRKKIFAEWAKNNTTPDDIPEYHFSSSPDQESAPFMYRSYSRTKSITTMNIQNADITMSHRLIPLEMHQGTQKQPDLKIISA